MYNPFELIRARTFSPEGDPLDHENVERQLASLCLLEADRVLYKPKPGGVYAQRHFIHYTHLLMDRAIHTRPNDPAVLDWQVTSQVENASILRMAEQIVNDSLNQGPHS